MAVIIHVFKIKRALSPKLLIGKIVILGVDTNDNVTKIGRVRRINGGNFMCTMGKPGDLTIIGGRKADQKPFAFREVIGVRPLSSQKQWTPVDQYFRENAEAQGLIVKPFKITVL